MRKGFSTPILLVAFNRPDYVQAQIEILRQVKPQKLYVSTDGARSSKPGEAAQVQEVQNCLKDIDWPCEVKKRFLKENAGCRAAVSSAIDWFFSHESEGIILEDDCQADASFFYFCQELLNKYRHQSEIMHISGTSFLPASIMKTSYTFNHHPLCWGWATWRRAWKKYDVEMKDWPEKKKHHFLDQPFLNNQSQAYWSSIFDLMYEKKVDTWDYQWAYAVWKHQGLCLYPQHNMVKNVGFDFRATHTKLSFFSFTSPPVTATDFPLRHPQKVGENLDVDLRLQQFFEGPLHKQVLIKILKLGRSLLNQVLQ